MVWEGFLKEMTFKLSPGRVRGRREGNIRQKEEAVKTCHSDILLAVPESDGPSDGGAAEEHGGGSKPEAMGQREALVLATSTCSCAPALFAPPSGTSQAIGQMFLRGTCLTYL